MIRLSDIDHRRVAEKRNRLASILCVGDIVDQVHQKEGNGRRAWRLLALPLALLAAAVALFFAARHFGVRAETISEWIRGIAGEWWAPLAFIAIYAIGTTFFFPATMLIVAAGAVWGTLEGGTWALVAGVAASSITYFAGRLESGDFSEILRNRAARVHGILERDGFLALLVLRFVPLAPFAVVNYAAGVAGIGKRDYFLATALGMAPGSFILSYFASAITAGIVTPRAAAGRIAIAGILLIALTIIGRIVGRRYRER